MDRIRIGYPAGYFRFFWIRIGFGYLFLKKIGSGSGYLFDFYNEISLRVIQDVKKMVLQLQAPAFQRAF